MEIRVDGRRVALARGMTVRHALIAAGLLERVLAGARVLDTWGNEVGLDGALDDGDTLTVVERPAR
jgi:hypothetical protein